MSSLEIPRPVVLENDPQDLRIDEYGDGVVYRWNTDQGPDPVIRKVQDFNLNGPVFTDNAQYETLTDAVEDDVLDGASSFFVVYGLDTSVSWETSDGEYLAEIGIVNERNANTELVDTVYKATTGGKLESTTIEEIRSILTLDE